MTIKDVLVQLDPMADSDWTAEGLPAIAAVKDRLGTEVSRKQVTDAWPEFNRDLAIELEVADGPSSDSEDEIASDDLAPTDSLQFGSASPHSERQDTAYTRFPTADDGLVFVGQIAVSELLDGFERLVMADKAVTWSALVELELEDLRDWEKDLSAGLTEMSKLMSAARTLNERLIKRLNEVATAVNHKSPSDSHAQAVARYHEQTIRSMQKRNARRDQILKIGIDANDMARRGQSLSPLDRSLQNRPRTKLDKPVLRRSVEK